jgi:ankyrin repeat protein
MTLLRTASVTSFALLLTITASARQEKVSFYLQIQRDLLDAHAVRESLAKGANPNMGGTHSVYADTPLVAAVRNDNLAVARVLVEAGANLNPTIALANDPPLHVALARSDDIFLFLLNKGASPNQPDRFGRPPLYWVASDPQHYDKGVMLIAAGANVRATEDGDTLLVTAVRAGNTRMAELLVRKGLDVNTIDQTGRTPLMSVRSVRLARFLVEHGADINALDNRGQPVEFHHPSGPIRDFLLGRKAAR